MRRLKRWLRLWLGCPEARRLLVGSTLATLWLWGGVAQAATGHGGGDPVVNWWSWDPHAPPVGWFIVDFVIFVWIIVHFTRKPIREAFAQRHHRIKQAIEDAAKDYRTAHERYEDFRTKLAHVEGEATQHVERGRKEGALERDRLVGAVRDYVDRLRSDSHAVIDQEIERARERLRRESVTEVLKQAEDILRSALTEADRQRLVEEAIANLDKDDAPTAGRRLRPTNPRALGGADSAAGETP